MAERVDVPIEVCMIDGTRWIVYYRCIGTFGDAIQYLRDDIREGKLRPAEDLDGVQRRHSQINLAYVVSAREVEQPEDGERP